MAAPLNDFMLMSFGSAAAYLSDKEQKNGRLIEPSELLGKRLVLLTGKVGSGRSLFLRQLAQENKETVEYISVNGLQNVNAAIEKTLKTKSVKTIFIARFRKDIPKADEYQAVIRKWLDIYPGFNFVITFDESHFSTTFGFTVFSEAEICLLVRRPATKATPQPETKQETQPDITADPFSKSAKKNFEPTSTSYDDLFREVMQSPELQNVRSATSFFLEDARRNFEALTGLQSPNTLSSLQRIFTNAILSLRSSASSLESVLKKEPELQKIWTEIFLPCIVDFYTELEINTEVFPARHIVSDDDTKRITIALFEFISLSSATVAVSPDVGNYLAFFAGSSQQPFIFNETHKEQIIREIFGEPYERSKFVSKVWGYFESLSGRIELGNSENLGVFITAVLYHPKIKSIWDITAPETEQMIFNSGNLISPFNRDSASDVDHLDFSPDVQALAALIAYQKTPLPLAIGLFGNWGSGKSSFMKQLRKRIDKLGSDQLKLAADQNQSAPAELPFCTNVVHISFNAWHFSDANLWASIMAHIFESLAWRFDHSESEEDSLRKRMQEELETAKAAKESSKQELSLAEQKTMALEAQLNKLNDENDLKISQLRDLTIKDVFGGIMTEPSVQAQLARFKEETQVAFETQEFSDVMAELNQMRSGLMRSGGRFREMLKRFHSMNAWEKILLLVLLIAPPVVVSILQFAGAEIDWKWITSGIAFFASIVTGIGRVVTPALSMFNKKLDAIEAAEAKLKSIREKKQEEIRRTETVLKTELERLQQDLVITRKKHDEASDNVNRLKAEIDNLSLDQQFIRFVRSRQGADGYHKHLGIISTIRKDFIKLRQLLGFPANDDYFDPIVGDAARPQGLDNPEKVPAQKLVDRIVLYIDDLDRCPADQVVAVLEAIHLLMAFDLFVVVVGVDARWVSKALREKYKNQLVATETDKRGVPLPGRQATPFDYLEKIFQVPFVVRPMEKKAAENLLEALFKDQVQKNKSNQTVVFTPDKTNEDESGEQKNETDIIFETDEQISGDDQNTDNPENKNDQHTDSENSAAVLRQAENLQISTEELNFIKHIIPLIGTTPRTLIRYVNLYRILRVHQSTPDYSEKNLDEYKAIMLLLAASVGAGTITEQFFAEIGSSDDKDFGTYVKSCIDHHYPGKKELGDSAKRWIRFLEKDEAAKERISLFPMHKLREYAPIVARFSYRTLEILSLSDERKKETESEQIIKGE